MAVVSNLSSILKHYANKQKSPFIDYKEFSSYVKKYAEHHVEEEAALVKYLGDASQVIASELLGLSEKHIVGIADNNGKKIIICIQYLANYFAQKYKEMLTNETIPYPIVSDLPKNFPLSLLEKKQASDYIIKNLGENQEKSQTLYILEFSSEIPSLLLPAIVPIKVLLETAQQKIKKILKKEEYHDYFIKKLRSTNPTKELSLKSFFTHFIDTTENNFIEFDQGDDYYIWNQLLYYIRLDFQKIQDRTIEDINILQAVQISEIHSTFLKQKFQNQQKKEDALKELEENLAKPPYFYSINQILKFKDKSGRLLYGNYDEKDLKEFLTKMTQEGPANELPQLLIFKVESGTRYYVYKRKVIQVVVRLCNEANSSIGKALENKWYESLLNYEKLKEMTDNVAFEKVLHKMVEKYSPVLHALLTSNFMNLLALEKDDDETLDGFHLFVNQHLLPYQDLLMLKNTQILANAKSRLPLIYSIPIVSWIISLFNSNRKNKKKKITGQTQKEENQTEQKEKPKTKAEIISSKAKDIAQEMVPEGSTVDRELDFLEKQWNKLISKEARLNLTEDVNSLIRDYTRRVANTISAQTFSKERVENLATALVRTPNMQKIKEEKALTEYVILYMLRLLSNN